MAIAYYKMSLEQLEKAPIKIDSLEKLIRKYLWANVFTLSRFTNKCDAIEYEVPDMVYDKVLQQRVPGQITVVGKKFLRHVETYPKDLKKLSLPEIAQRAAKAADRARSTRWSNFLMMKRKLNGISKYDLVFDHLLKTDYETFKKRYPSFSEREMFHIVNHGTGHCLCYYIALRDAIHLSMEEFLQDGIIQHIYHKYSGKERVPCYEKVSENWQEITDYVKKKLFHNGWKVLNINDNDWEYNGQCHEWIYDVKKEYIHIAPYHVQMLSADCPIRERSVLINQNIYLVRKEE